MSNMITCQLCNKQFKNKIQYSHLKKFHGITRGEYEANFGKGSTVANYVEEDIPEEQRIECRICNSNFKNVITAGHLKTHGYTTKMYKERYGEDSLTTQFYRDLKSQQSKGENNGNYGNKWSDDKKRSLSDLKKKGYEEGLYCAHNTGKSMSMEQRKKLSEVKKEGFKTGKYTPHNKGVPMNEAQRKDISKSIREYARNNPEELSERAKKAYKTRMESGLTFTFAGNTHSEETKKVIGEKSALFAKNNSEMAAEKARRAYLTRQMKGNPFTSKGTKLSNEAKNRIGEKSRAFWSEESTKRVSAMKDFMHDEGYRVLEMDDAPTGYVTFICNCGSDREHTCTRQQFYPSKYVPYDGVCRFCDMQSKSRGEMEIAAWIESLGVKVEINTRSVIYPKEIDIYMPEHKIAIEFNGLYWHSELVGKNRYYHLQKLKDCKEKGITLLQIFEDEWYNKPALLKSMIMRQLGFIERRIYARKTTVQEISPSMAREFVDEYHISGYHASKYKFGLFLGDELVSVMTFSTGNYSRKSLGWEIDRFCSKSGVQVVGGASKLFKAFITKVNPSEVISYADLRYGTGKVYEHLGFEYEKDTVPNFWYFKNELVRHHRFSLRKGVVEGDDPSLTEWENRINQGWNRIWDCGSSKYVWTNTP